MGKGFSQLFRFKKTMIPIFIIIAIIILISFFALGFLYDGVFLYAACVLSIIIGLLFITSGIEIKTGETTNSYIAGNETITDTTIEYSQFNNSISNGIGLIFILLGFAFIYFERKNKQDQEDKWGQDGKWL